MFIRKSHVWIPRLIDSFINNRIKTVEALSPFLLTPIILSFSRDIYKKHAYHVSSFLFFFIVSINSLLKWNWTQICIYCLFWMEEEYSLRWKEKIKKLYNYFLLVRNICQLFQIWQIIKSSDEKKKKKNRNTKYKFNYSSYIYWLIFRYCLNNCLNNRYNQFNLNRIKFHNSKEVYTKKLNNKKFRLKNKTKKKKKRISIDIQSSIEVVSVVLSRNYVIRGHRKRTRNGANQFVVITREIWNDRSSGNIFTTTYEVPISRDIRVLLSRFFHFNVSFQVFIFISSYILFPSLK